MLKVVSVEEMRELDNNTINNIGIPGIVLMERAAGSCADAVIELFPETDFPLTYVFAGKGNNGGDGLAIARYLLEAGFNVKIFSTVSPGEFKGDAGINAAIAVNLKIPWEMLESKERLDSLPEPDIIIDALFGTGFSGKAEGLYSDIIQYINHNGAFTLSVDIPSGISGNSPLIEGECVQADITVTMAAVKIAHLFYPARYYVGELQIADIGIPAHRLNNPALKINLIEQEDIYLPYRHESNHKYNFGRILIIAGSKGMTGAAVMAASAASITGGGMVHLAVPETVYPIAASHLLGEIVIPVEDNKAGVFSPVSSKKLAAEIEWADCILVGPGIGREKATLMALKDLLTDINKPLIIDADALQLLTEEYNASFSGKNIIITPHYGEMAAVSSLKPAEISANPIKAAKEFAERKGVTVNLKNAPSLVATPFGEVYINSTGNTALAKAGSGDVLAGILIGLLGQRMDVTDAVYTANYIHGKIADTYSENFGEHSLTPETMLKLLPEVLKNF